MTLYPIDECPDLMVDACVCDEDRKLVFLSAWGRDTAVQEFLARLTLGRDEQGLDQFHITVDSRALPVFPNTEFLEKRTTRQLRGTLFGSLIHLWLFDSRASLPDLANHFAYALLDQHSAPHERLWPLVMSTCPLPLLDHWREPVMEILTTHQMLTLLPGSIGSVRAWRLSIQIDVLEASVGQLVRRDQLTLEAQAQA